MQSDGSVRDVTPICVRVCLNASVVAIMHCRRTKKQGKVWTCRKLSLRGGYRLALLRNSGYASTDNVIQQHEVGVKRQSLNHWEHVLAAHARFQSHRWYSEHYEYLASLPQVDSVASSRDEGRPFTYEIHTIRADATNSNAKLGSKAMTCEVASTFGYLVGELRQEPCHLAAEEDSAALPPSVMSCIALSDMQVVPDKCGARETHELLEKQTRAVGARAWVSEWVSDVSSDLPLVPSDSNFVGHICTYVFGTDQGPDQKGSDRIIDSHVSASGAGAGGRILLKFRQWCLQHCVHLMVPPSKFHGYSMRCRVGRWGGAGFDWQSAHPGQALLSFSTPQHGCRALVMPDAAPARMPTRTFTGMRTYTYARTRTRALAHARTRAHTHICSARVHVCRHARADTNASMPSTSAHPGELHVHTRA